MNSPTPRYRGTHSALSAWSWYDVARLVAGGAAGGLVAALLSTWLAPEFGYPPDLRLRLLHAALLALLWAVPITAGLALAAGQRRRAPRVWARQAVLTVLVTAGAAAVLAVLLTLLPVPRGTTVRYLTHPVIFWMVLALIIVFGFGVGFRRAYAWPALLVAALVGGAIAGLAFPRLLDATGGLPVGWARAALAFSLLLPAGALLGFLIAALRELTKMAWLQVIYGDEPGRHYPIYATPLTIGFAPDNLLVLDPTGGVHPHHAVIRRTADDIHIEPLAPGAMVYLHDRRLGMSELYDGDELQIGETVLRYYVIP